METPSSVPEVVAWIGLDWADQRHEIRLTAAGSARTESFTVEQNPPPCTPGPAKLRSLGRHPGGRERGQPFNPTQRRGHAEGPSFSFRLRSSVSQRLEVLVAVLTPKTSPERAT